MATVIFRRWTGAAGATKTDLSSTIPVQLLNNEDNTGYKTKYITPAAPNAVNYTYWAILKAYVSANSPAVTVSGVEVWCEYGDPRVRMGRATAYVQGAATNFEANYGASLIAASVKGSDEYGISAALSLGVGTQGATGDVADFLVLQFQHQHVDVVRALVQHLHLQWSEG